MQAMSSPNNCAVVLIVASLESGCIMYVIVHIHIYIFVCMFVSYRVLYMCTIIVNACIPGIQSCVSIHLYNTYII